MALFLTEEEQELTEPFYSVGLWCIPNDKDLNIITASYFDDGVEYYLFNIIRIITKHYIDDCVEYYLFDKIRIWKNER